MCIEFCAYLRKKKFFDFVDHGYEADGIQWMHERDRGSVAVVRMGIDGSGVRGMTAAAAEAEVELAECGALCPNHVSRSLQQLRRMLYQDHQ